MSNKTSTAAAAAFMQGVPFGAGNTTVTVDAEVTCMYLHGNLIAQRSIHGLSVSDGGYHMSGVTKSRLNAIPGVIVRTVRGLPYIHGERYTGGWYHIPTT
jgi:hypothetical protein